MIKTLMIIAVVFTFTVGTSSQVLAKNACYIKYEGNHTVFLICDNGITFKTTPEHLKAMLRVEDLSIKNPAGGKHSVVNEAHDKIAKKPVRWVKKVFGF